MPDEVRNVVLVIVDALRRDRVGTYQSDRDLTPNIDKLASRGTVFENAFTCTNTTDPSVTSIHTGRDPDTVIKHHGPFVTEEEKRRVESVAFVPKILQENGLHTLATGRTLSRWHKRGFEYYPEPLMGRYQRRAIGERLEKISPRLRELAGKMYEGFTSAFESAGGGPSDEIDEFLDAVEEQPFYGMVHMMDTHAPYTPDDDLVDELLRQYDYPNQDLREFLDEHRDNEYVRTFIMEEVDERDYRDGLARWYAKYDAAAVEADRKVGKLVDGLREAGRLDETAILVLSDHGESLDEHGIYFEHHGLYDPQIRVPLVVTGPAIPDDRRGELVQLNDVAPTLIDILNVDESLDCDGRSLQPLLGGTGEWNNREFVVAQEAHAQRRIAVRTRDFKLIKHEEDEVLERERGSSFRCGYCDTVHGGERELYDLRDDPRELNDVVTERPDRVADLDEQLSSHFEALSYPDTGSEQVEYEAEEEVLDQLEDLGYR